MTSGVAVVVVVEPAASPIGTTIGSHGGTHIEDFEDGDTTVDATGWIGWNGDTGSLSATSSNVITGDFSGKFTVASANQVVDITRSTNTSPTRIAYRFNVTATQTFEVIIRSGTDIVTRVRFSGGDIEVDEGTFTDTGRDALPDTVYAIELKNIDWSADTFDLYVNGYESGTYDFHTAASGLDNIRVHAITSSTETVVFDDIQFDGSDFTVDLATPDTTIDSFEDQDISEYGGDAGDFSTSTDWSRDGSVSLNLSSSGSAVNQIASIEGLPAYPSPGDKFRVWVNVTRNETIGFFFAARDADGTPGGYRVTVGGTRGNLSLAFGKPDGTIVFLDRTNYPNDINKTDKEFVVTWTTDNTITVDILDANGNTEASVQATNSSYITGGIGFVGDTDSGDPSTFFRWDYYRTTTIPTTNTVSGTVTNQHGDPIQGATVQVWGVDYDQLTPGAGETKKGLAIEELRDAWNKTTAEWTDQAESNFRLVGTNGHFGSVTATYAAVHTQGDWNRPFFQAGPISVDADPQLGDPLLHVPASGGETVRVYVSLWDATKEPLVQDGVDEDLPGVTTTGTVVVKGVSATGEILDERRVETEPIFKRGLPAVGKTHQAAIVTLPPGYYQVHPAGNEAGGYTLKVGDPPEFISDALDTETQGLTSQASDTAQDLSSGKFTKDTATTSADGSWSVSTGASVKTVAVQAYKAESVASNDSGLTPEEIITHYNDCEDLVDSAGSSFGAVYLPSEIERVDPPASNVTVELREVSVPSYGDLTAADVCVADRLRDLLNESYADALGLLQQRLNATSSDDLTTIYKRLKQLYQENRELRDRVDELRKRDGDEGPVVIDGDDATDAELRERIRDLEEALEELRSAIEGTTETTVGSGTISQTFTFDVDIDPASTLVLVHYSNGTTVPLGTQSQYVRVEKRPGRPDQVLVEAYPLGEADPSSVVFEVVLGSEDGTRIGRARNRVVNPRFSGEVPGLDSIRVSTLRPGPSEHVTIEVNPADASVFGSVTGVTVVGPAGNSIATDAITDGVQSGFTTDGAGVYHVEVAFNNSGGDAFTETFRLRAASTDDPRPATVEVRHGPTGSWVLAGDGLSGGRVSVEDSGATVDVTARVAPGDDVPGSIHVHTEGVDTSPRTTTVVRVVRGEHGEAVRQRLGIVLYTDALGDTPVLYRETDALPRSGSNQHGRVIARGNGTTIQTFTEADGTVRIVTDRDPGLIARGLYRARLAGVPIPGSIGIGIILPRPGPVPPPPDPVGAIEDLLTEVLA